MLYENDVLTRGFPFTVVEFCDRWIVYNSRRGRFVNSAFPNKKNLAQQRILFMTNKFESKCLQKFYVSSKHEKECYMKTTSYLEEPNRHFCQHFMRRTTQQTFSGYKLGESTENNKALLFFLGKETIQTFSGSIEAITLLFAQ